MSLRFDVLAMCRDHDALTSAQSRKDIQAFARNYNNHVRLVYFALSLVFEWGIDETADKLARWD